MSINSRLIKASVAGDTVLVTLPVLVDTHYAKGAVDVVLPGGHKVRIEIQDIAEVREAPEDYVSERDR